MELRDVSDTEMQVRTHVLAQVELQVCEGGCGAAAHPAAPGGCQALGYSAPGLTGLRSEKGQAPVVVQVPKAPTPQQWGHVWDPMGFVPALRREP